MTQARISKHKVVSFTYQILDEAGDIAEHSDVPMEYIHGHHLGNGMYPKVEQALDGKAVNDLVEVVLPPKDGFGEYDPELAFTDDIDNVPEEFRWVGARPTFENEKGEVVEFEVSKIENGKLTVNGNHPFAGKTVTFRITVVSIRQATEADLKQVALGSRTLQ